MSRPSARFLAAALVLGCATAIPAQDAANEKAMMEAWQKAACYTFGYNPPLEAPSDLAGVCYIDITHGIGPAGEEIRRELVEWL